MIIFIENLYVPCSMRKMRLPFNQVLKYPCPEPFSLNMEKYEISTIPQGISNIIRANGTRVVYTSGHVMQGWGSGYVMVE